MFFGEARKENGEPYPLKRFNYFFAIMQMMIKNLGMG